jgi:hypothetical protein
MSKTHKSSPTARRSRFIAAAIAVIVAASSLAAASPALAKTPKTKAPTGDFTIFTPCPRFTAGVNFCILSTTTSGEVVLGLQGVPITAPIVLQGGIIRNEETEAESFVEPIGGETLSKAAQKVPGGLLGLVKCDELTDPVFRISCEREFENGLTGVNAVAELARPASEIKINKDNLVNGEGTALTLPVKFHLENPLLGSDCYIGSSAHPITWNLTTGTTDPPFHAKPLTGKIGELEFKDKGTFTEITGNSLVDNTFSVPAASGCGGIFSAILDPLLDLKIALPSPAGFSSAVLNNTIQEATAKAVLKSEKKI